MKTKSKALLLTLCAVLLVAASILGTMAYLTSTAKVENTFTVGNVAITLDEDQVDTDGKGLDVEANKRVKANSYKLMPGHEYDKDPTIHVAAGSEDCYLFVKVENGIANIEAGTIASQMANHRWFALGDENYPNIYVYGTKKTVNEVEGIYPETVKAKNDVHVFDNFQIKGDVENIELANYDQKTIVVTAYAVQKDGFDETPAALVWARTFGAPTPEPVEPAE